MDVTPDTTIVSVTDAARTLGLSEPGVRYLERTGKLRAFRTTRGQRLFLMSDVEALARQRAGL